MSLWSAILVEVYFCSGVESFVKAFLLVNLFAIYLNVNLSQKSFKNKNTLYFLAGRKEQSFHVQN